MSILRILQTQNMLSDQGLSGAVIFYSRDMYYLTGTAQPGCLILKPDDYRLCIHHGKEVAARETWIPTDKMIFDLKWQHVFYELFPGQGKGERVGALLDVLPAAKVRKVQKTLGQREMVNFSPSLLELRAIKDDLEVEFIKRACVAVDAGHKAAISALEPGVTELEISAAIENAHRLAGHEGLFFMRQHDFVMGRGPLASGPNLQNISGVVFSITGTGLTPAVPAGASRRRLSVGDLVLVDIPTCVMGYHADQTRMYALERISRRARDAYVRLHSVADFVIDALRPGQTCNEVFTMAMEKAKKFNLAESFLRFPSGIRAHFVGHGLGLELNEPPLLAKGNEHVLQAGMVLALEMHICEQNSLTLKLEDTVLLSDSGCQLLTQSPRDLSCV